MDISDLRTQVENLGFTLDIQCTEHGFPHYLVMGADRESNTVIYNSYNEYCVLAFLEGVIYQVYHPA